MTIAVTWLGHSTFLITTPEGKTILIDPWVENNPMCPAGLKKLKGVDLMLITHAHFDHIGDAVHSCGIQDGSQIIYGGEAAGYVLKFSNGRVFYHSGDTALFGDMALIAELYKPDTVFLPIGDHFTMGPREAARACALLKAKQVVPMHFGSFPLLTGRPAALQEWLTGGGAQEENATKVVEFKPGEMKEI